MEGISCGLSVPYLFFVRYRRRIGYRFRWNERSRSDKSHAHYLSRYESYMAVGIALASDVLASAVSAYTYGKSKNLDIKNGLVMMSLSFALHW